MSGVFFLIGRLEVWKNLLTYLTIDFFLYKAFTTFGVENCAFHFLGDGESLVDGRVLARTCSCPRGRWGCCAHAWASP